jgi:hypothetical protein
LITIGVELEYRSIARSFSGGTNAFVFVFSACYETLEFKIEYAYLLGMKMSSCPVRASCALLIGLGYVLPEVVVCCLSIARRFGPVIGPC